MNALLPSAWPPPAAFPCGPCSAIAFRMANSKLTLPVDGAGQLPVRAVLLRSLYQPNDKLVELLLAARAARGLGVRHLTLVAPYLAYMRQDIAFHPGEAVSQRIVGPFLASLFDAVVTVDPHLHRVATLPEAVPAAQAVVVSGAPLLADWIVQQRPGALLVGPDGESAQWVAQAASATGCSMPCAPKSAMATAASPSPCRRWTCGAGPWCCSTIWPALAIPWRRPPPAAAGRRRLGRCGGDPCPHRARCACRAARGGRGLLLEHRLRGPCQ